MFITNTSKCTQNVKVWVADVQNASTEAIAWYARNVAHLRTSDYFDATINVADDFSADEITQTALVTFWTD